MIVFSISALSAEIIPLKKPLQTKEEKEQKLLKDSLKPLPKPKAKIEVKPEAEVVESKITKKTNIILPKKKPRITGTQQKKVED